mmetsp:Transcript_22104/g.71348  ORF Transcript_22104/g.71348 Transcript_22104/m.71348 type:complete len:208 (-) Transcript_22104:1306-1929(-)
MVRNCPPAPWPDRPCHPEPLVAAAVHSAAARCGAAARRSRGLGAESPAGRRIGKHARVQRGQPARIWGRRAASLLFALVFLRVCAERGRSVSAVRAGRGAPRAAGVAHGAHAHAHEPAADALDGARPPAALTASAAHPRRLGGGEPPPHCHRRALFTRRPASGTVCLRGHHCLGNRRHPRRLRGRPADTAAGGRRCGGALRAARAHH